MAKLFGGDYTREELFKRVGDMSMVAGIREYTYNSGRADGVRAIEVNTGALRFEVLPSRALDISTASYRGVPFGYTTKSGLRNPAYFSQVDPRGFLDNFFAGVLTTCGLHNIGGPAELGGRLHSQHGEISNIPAELVSVAEEWDGDECRYVVSGEVRHSRFYAEDLVLRRKITTSMGASSFVIEDEVENRDFAPSPCIILYHSQIGFPFLNDATKFIGSPIAKSEPRPGVPQAEADTFGVFAPPEDGRAEACIYHTFTPDADGMATAGLFNPRLGENGMGVYVRFSTATLPHFVQWKMLRSREYVCGLEPSSARLDDRSQAEVDALTLKPMEKRKFRVEYGVIEGEDAMRAFAGGDV